MATIAELINNPLNGNPTGLLALLEDKHGDSFKRYNVLPWSFNSARLSLDGDGGWRIQNPTPITKEQAGRWNVVGTTWTLWLGKVIAMDNTKTLDEWRLESAQLHGQIQSTITNWCNCQAPNLPSGMPTPGGGVFDQKADTSTGRSNAVRQYLVLAWSVENLNVEAS